MPEATPRWFRGLWAERRRDWSCAAWTPLPHVLRAAPDEQPTDVRAGHAEELFEQLDPGSSEALREYLDSGAEVYEAGEEALPVYGTSPPHGPRAHRGAAQPAAVGRLPSLSSATRAARFRDRGSARSWATPPCSWRSPDTAPAMHHLTSHLGPHRRVQHPVAGASPRSWTPWNALCARPGWRSSPAPRSAASRSRPHDPHRGPSRARPAHDASAGSVTGVTYRVGSRAASARSGSRGKRPAHRCRGPAPPADPPAAGAFPAPEVALTATRLSGARAPACGEAAAARARQPAVHRGLGRQLRRIADGSPLAEETSIYVSMTSATTPAPHPRGREPVHPAPSPAAGSGGGGGVRTPDMDEPAVPRRWSGRRCRDRAARALGGHPGPRRADPAVRRTDGPEDFEAQFNAWRGSTPAGPRRGSRRCSARVSRHPGIAGLLRGVLGAPGIGVPMCLISSQVVLDRSGTRGRLMYLAVSARAPGRFALLDRRWGLFFWLRAPAARVARAARGDGVFLAWTWWGSPTACSGTARTR
ncbi:phytoene desaturase [Kocuria rhizophila]|nr:phytoene desaturase [Kocuria rhizophila]